MNELFRIETSIREFHDEMRLLHEQAADYCKGKLFRIVGNIYYYGTRRSLKGRRCKLTPWLCSGELLYGARAENLRTGKFDIDLHYGFQISQFEEIEDEQ